MNWFFIALAAPLLWAVTNHFDKYLVFRFSKEIKFTSFIISSGFYFLIFAVFILLFKHSVLQVSVTEAVLMLVAGAFGIYYIFPYYIALSLDEASVVVPMYQMVPIIGFVLGFIFLKEHLTSTQIIAGLIIISGSLGLSLDFSQKIRLKGKVFLLMFASSLVISIEALIYKSVAVRVGYWTSIFWLQSGFAFFSLLLLIFRNNRVNFIQLVVRERPFFFGLIGIIEVFNTGAFLLFDYAYLLAPIALVQLVGSIQPLFVFLIGTMASFLAFRQVSENISVKFFAQKVIFICLILAGSYLLFRNL